MKIRYKIALSFAAICFILAIVTAFIFIHAHQINKDLERIHESTSVELSTLTQLRHEVNHLTQLALRTQRTHSGNIDEAKEALELQSIDVERLVNRLDSLCQAHLFAQESEKSSPLSIPASCLDKEMVVKLRNYLKKINQITNELHVDKGFKRDHLINDIRLINNHLSSALSKSNASIESGLAKISKEAKNSIFYGISMSFLVIFLSLVLGRSLYKSIAIPLGKMNAGIDEISKGNLQSSIVHDKNDEFGALISNFQSMANNLKIANSEIKVKNRRLERLNKNLKKAKTKAESADRLKSAFLANISHEIRTPMNGIIGFTELMEDPNLMHDERQTYLKIIKRSSDQLLKLIDDILDISKLEAQEFLVTKRAVDFKTIWTDIERYYSKNEFVGNNNLKINFKFEQQTNTSLIYTDDFRLKQIFMNLINNAIKFTDEGSIDVITNLTENQLLCEISDTGRGIEKKELPLLFKHFGQAQQEITIKTAGTGLGLAIVKGILEVMGGSISVKSKKDVGTTFSFTIPTNH